MIVFLGKFLRYLPAEVHIRSEGIVKFCEASKVGLLESKVEQFFHLLDEDRVLSLKLCHFGCDFLGTFDPDAVLVVAFREKIVAETDWNRLKP